MADPQTYAELQTEIIAWSHRDDLDANVPSFIALAERRFNRVLRLPEMEQVSTSDFATGTITLPTDFLELKSAYLNADPIVALEQTSVDDLQRLYADGETGTPRYFALQSATEMVFGPEPDATYSAVINYYQKIPALSDANTTNWLLLTHPDVYLAAAMVEAMTFTRDREAMTDWLTVTTGKLGEIMAEGVRKARSKTPRRLTADPLLTRCWGSTLNLLS